MDYLIVFVCHTLFICLRTSNVKLIAGNEILKSTLMSVLISAVWCGSFLFGVDKYIKGDDWMIPIYIIGSGLGTYLGHIDFRK